MEQQQRGREAEMEGEVEVGGDFVRNGDDMVKPDREALGTKEIGGNFFQKTHYGGGNGSIRTTPLMEVEQHEEQHQHDDVMGIGQNGGVGGQVVTGNGNQYSVYLNEKQGTESDAVDDLPLKKKDGNDEAHASPFKEFNGNGMSSEVSEPELQSRQTHTFVSKSEPSKAMPEVPFHNKSASSSSGEKSAEIDLEQVLEEQDTHDLFCPNCKSCITRRVILRKRKRILREPVDTKRGKIPSTKDNVGGASAVLEIKDEAHDTEPEGSAVPEITEEAHDREPDVFRCLSCFSFFIPTDGGFKLFKIFGKGEESEKVQNSPREPSKNENWMSSLFGSMKPKKKENESENLHAHLVTSATITVGETSQEVVRSMTSGTASVVETSQEVVRSMTSGTANVVETSQEVVKGVTTGTMSTVITSQEVVSYDISETNELSVSGDQDDGKRKAILAPNGTKGSDKAPLLEHIAKPMIGETSRQTSRKPGQVLPVSMAPGTSALVETHIYVGEQIASTGEQQAHDWDVLKAIVYGGLVESITSLGVVSSASGSDASTLNIVALGLANLIGGLFLLIHDLMDLRGDEYQVVDKEKIKTSRYWKLLGRKGHFKLHAFVAIMSFIIVGLLPPVIYGFTFQKSDNKEYKLIAVAAASLLCISLLAIGKAHVTRRPKPYLSTLSTYLVIGVTASGLSYVAGVLVQRFFEQLGLFDNGSTVPSPPLAGFLELNPTNSSWSSY